MNLMYSRENKEKFLLKKDRQFTFIPRIINPVKITNVIIFSADELVRRALKVIQDTMPWVDAKVFSDPTSILRYQSNQASIILFDDTAMTLIDTKRLNKNNQDIVLVLLSSNEFIQRSPPSVARQSYPYTSKADLIFAVNHTDLSPNHIVDSVVRCAEDRLNIMKYSTARRYIFLIVDDEPRWFSQFLPVLYNIIGQRADVMVTRTYEETLEFLFGMDDELKIGEKNYFSHGYGDNVICIITDIFFPKGNDLNCEAGRDIIRLIHKYYPRIPIIIASKAEIAEDLKEVAFNMPKGDQGSLEMLNRYIHDFTGMGDFIIKSRTGELFYRIKDIHSLYAILLEAEKDTEEAGLLRDTLEHYGKRDHFSTWLYMHGFRDLGDQLRPKHDVGRRLVTVLKRYIKREILRMKYTPLNIDGIKIYELNDLLELLNRINPKKIQELSDNDMFSTWLDRKGYSELAEELRPIHGSGKKLIKVLTDVIGKWMKI